MTLCKPFPVLNDTVPQFDSVVAAFCLFVVASSMLNENCPVNSWVLQGI